MPMCFYLGFIDPVSRFGIQAVVGVAYAALSSAIHSFIRIQNTALVSQVAKSNVLSLCWLMLCDVLMS